MAEHPIQGLMVTAMNSIKDMVDVNTIVGDAVQAPDGTVIIPISTVSFGFAAGGGEYDKGHSEETRRHGEEERTTVTHQFPFAGGSGAGVSITPVAFMVVGQNQIRMIPVSANSAVDRLVELIPDLIEKATDSVKNKIREKKNCCTTEVPIKPACDKTVVAEEEV